MSTSTQLVYWRNAGGALVFLEEGSGKLLRPSKAACEEACRNCSALEGAETEMID